MNKVEIWQFIYQKVENELVFLQMEWKKQQESVWNETKSSAGDKHETGRAMAQLEVEQLGKTLREKENLLKDIQKISTETIDTKISLGSLVHTSQGIFYFSIGLGMLKIKDQTIFCVSLQSPISIHFMGKTIGENVQFQGKSFEILRIE